MPKASPSSLRSSPRRWGRRVLALLAILLLLPFAGLGLAMARMWPDPAPGFEGRRGALERVVRSVQPRGDLVREDLRVSSTSGLEVEVAVLRPTTPGPHPLLVLLVGQETGKEAVELFDHTGDTAVAAIRYPYDGAYRFGLVDGLLAIPSLQSALLDTTPAVMLALDALLLEPYVDATHVELVGVSLGALLGPKIAALDGRFSRVWLMHGAGDVVELIAHQMRNRLERPWQRKLLARALAALAGARHFAPEQWVGRISPRELILVNAVDDERMPGICVEALHAQVGQPSEIIWMPGAHVRTVRTDVVRELVDLVLARVQSAPGARPAVH